MTLLWKHKFRWVLLFSEERDACSLISVPSRKSELNHSGATVLLCDEPYKVVLVTKGGPESFSEWRSPYLFILLCPLSM